MKYAVPFFAILTGMLVHSHMKGADFHVFYTAGERVWNSVAVYRISDDWMPFKYHPAWAVFFSLLSRLPEKISLWIFNFAQLACWFTATAIWARRLGFDIKSWKSRLLLLLSSLSAFSAEIGFGQINGCIVLGLTMIFEWLERERPRPWAAGFVMGLLISLKLNLGLIAVYAVFKNWRTIFGAALAWIVLHILVAVFFGEWLALTPYGDWLTVMLTQSSDQFQMYEAQGLLRFFLWLAPFGKYLWAAALVAFCTFGVVRISREPKGSTWLAVYWMSGIFLFSPLAWWYQILYLYPLTFYILKNKTAKWQLQTALTCLLIFALVNFNTVGRVPMQRFKEMQGYFLCAAILFSLFMYLGLTQKKTAPGGAVLQ